MVHAIIVEDEPQVAEYLLFLLTQNHPNIKVKAIATTVAEAKKTIDIFQPHLVFLDVELGKETSFSLLEQFSQPTFEIIFTTSFDKYALQAIRLACIDYLLKPIKEEELAAAIEKYLIKAKTNVSQKRIELLLQSLNLVPEKFQKIAIPTSDGYEFVKISDIVYCEADSNYTWIHTTTGSKLLSSKSLKEYETILPTETFFRIHKSFLINLNCVKKFNRTEGNFLILENGHTVEVASRRKESFLQLINR